MNELPIEESRAQAIDRLVAGDLCEQEREELLKWFDEEPTRWRGCALAFLEAQLWQETFAATASPTPRIPVLPTPKKTRVRLRVLAAAAAVLLAFGLGLFSSLSRTMLEQAQVGVPSVAPLVVDRGNDGLPSHLAAQQTFAVVRVMSKGTEPREIHVPLVEGARLANSPVELPEAVQAQLERRGFHLEQRRRFVEVRLEDGRYALIPIDQYQVKYVGQRSS